MTQLTDEPPVDNLEQVQAQISGDRVAWMKGYNTGAIHLRNLITGETRQFTPRPTVVSWRLVRNRLAWQEMQLLRQTQLYLYDSAAGSVKTIEAAHGLLIFDMDENHIAWAGGPGWDEVYLYDLASGRSNMVAKDSQANGEFIVVKGGVLAWTGRTGDRTTMMVYGLETGKMKAVDGFGPYNPEIVSDGRYVAWNRGEEDSGTTVRVHEPRMAARSTWERGHGQASTRAALHG